MQGRRRYDFEPLDLEAGEYGTRSLQLISGGPAVEVWWFRTPNGLLGRLAHPEDVRLRGASGCHHVEEHEDGSITVLPQPGNSNSILTTDGRESWHGYIRAGVWEPC